jgi:uncharacterized protein YndB with AHSA1/START domain
MSSWRQEALIDASVADVWNLLVDPAKAPEWSEDVFAVTGVPIHIEKGSTFEMTSRGPLRMKGTTTFRVEELEELRELRMQCQMTGFYSHWILTEAQGGTFAEVELGVEPPESRRGVSGRAVGALHTKSFLRRTLDKLLDDLKEALSRRRTGPGRT